MGGGIVVGAAVTSRAAPSPGPAYVTPAASPGQGDRSGPGSRVHIATSFHARELPHPVKSGPKRVQSCFLKAVGRH
jgi:hypothetical protein